MGVGHKATHEVGLARVEGGHQLNQGDKVDGRHSLAATLLLLLALVLGGSGGLARVVFPEKDQKLTGGGGLHDLDDSVVDGVLVLLKPSSDIVRHDTGVVRDGKVGVLVTDTLVAKLHISVLLTKDISSSTSTSDFLLISQCGNRKIPLKFVSNRLFFSKRLQLSAFKHCTALNSVC